ncbi:lysozyme inhibitor LprI family protein [Kosakonia sp. BK9b]|uniref:lysozyme inhibitor LprI family protein n=1 Tax=Kosakonia sp. TaxID=1916651 RepID=UPI0028A265AC|nr:lysozyme inhibitor LprI family protein [Kosakonia sp.]
MDFAKATVMILSLATANAMAATLNLGNEVKHCLSLPAWGAGQNQAQCKEEAIKRSEKSLSATIAQLHAVITRDYNTPYHLNDPDGVKINDIFWEKFAKAQKLWLASRDEMCAASAALMGEWATSQDDIHTQCLIDQNKSRERYVHDTWLQ